MENSCCACLKSNATLVCGACQSQVCKKCAHFLAEDSFAFLPSIPEVLTHKVYCPQCFEAQVAGPLHDYERDYEAAKNISVYLKEQSKESRLLKRKEAPVVVKSCSDREETLLRLAFLAVRAKYNGLVDVEVVGKKVRSGAYQTQEYSGTGIPTHIPDRRR